ncbi:MAG: cytidylate kinase [Chthonomonadales bacterium]|nr:cytidylate kinase [Chthonomonadales bacterium]
MTIIIAIDGPAGAGKSTVARQVAAALGYTYLDTGAMYRSVAWKALRSEADHTREEAMEEVARNLDIRFTPLTSDGLQQVFADDDEVTADIRTPEVSDLTSRISAFPAVRRIVVEQQRRMGETAERGVVLEGRDIGTVVFPNAHLKIFLTASPEERARRRVKDLRGRGIEADYAQTLADQIARDTRDTHRNDSPLAAALDAVALSTDGLTIPEVVERILTLHRTRMEETLG